MSQFVRVMHESSIPQWPAHMIKHKQSTVYDVGDSTWIGCPIATAITTSAFYGLGGAYSHPGLFIVGSSETTT